MTTTFDPVQRQQKAEALDTIMRDTAPVIFLWQFHSLYGIQPYVKGFTPNTARKVDLTKVTVEKH